MGVMRRLGSATAALAICGLVAAGCTTQSQRIGADDGSDACRVHKVALDSTGDFFAEDMVKGAAVGALGGALMGGLIGGDWKSAAIGAAAGAVAGAATGYYQHLQQQKQDQAVLYNTVLSDLEKENAQIDQAQRAFNQLVGCRNNEANKIRADLKAGVITRPVAEARMATLRGQYQGDIKLARLVNENMTKRSANFEFANEQINPGTTTKVAEAPPSPTPAPVKKAAPKPAAHKPPATTPQGKVADATASNQAKRSSYGQSVETASRQTDGFVL